jgi:hypothetical protein
MLLASSNCVLTHSNLSDSERLDSSATKRTFQSPPVTSRRCTASPETPVSPPTISTQTQTGRERYRLSLESLLEVTAFYFISTAISLQAMYVWAHSSSETIRYCPYATYIPHYDDILREVQPQPDRGRARTHLQDSHGPVGQGGTDEEAERRPDYTYDTITWLEDLAEGCTMHLREGFLPDDLMT